MTFRAWRKGLTFYQRHLMRQAMLRVENSIDAGFRNTIPTLVWGTHVGEQKSSGEPFIFLDA